MLEYFPLTCLLFGTVAAYFSDVVDGPHGLPSDDRQSLNRLFKEEEKDKHFQRINFEVNNNRGRSQI